MNQKTCIVYARDLSKAIRFALDCVADEDRPAYRGVFLHSSAQDNKLTVSSTDGFQIAETSMPAWGEGTSEQAEFDLFVDFKSAEDLLALASHDSNTLRLRVAEEGLLAAPESSYGFSIFPAAERKAEFMSLAPSVMIDEFVVSRSLLLRDLVECRRKARAFCIAQNRKSLQKQFASAIPVVCMSRNQRGLFLHACALQKDANTKRLHIVESVRSPGLATDKSSFVLFDARTSSKMLKHIDCDSVCVSMLAYPGRSEAAAANFECAQQRYMRMCILPDDGFYDRLVDAEEGQ